MRRTPCFTWIFLAFLSGSAADSYQEAAGTITEITRTERYQKYLRPFHRGDTVNVSVGMTVLHFVEVKEILEEYSLDLFVWQQWKDARLNHSLPYTIILPGKSGHLIWLPDTFFLNVRRATVPDVMSENSRVSISPEGVVTYSTRVTLIAGCTMDLADYPLDEQLCDLELSTYAYPKDDLEYFWSEGANGDVITIRDEHLAEHTLTQRQALKEFDYHEDGMNGSKHSKLIARFWLRRRIGYVLIQIYVPITLLVALSWLSFWIPEEAVPARVALGATTVLSVVTFTGSFRGTLPKVSYVKAVDVYFIVSFAFVFGAVLEFVIVLLHSGFKREMSKKIDCTSTKNKKDEDYAADAGLEEIKVETPGSKKVRSRKVSPKPGFNAKEYLEYVFKQNVASPIDKACRYLFPCCYLAFNLIYWIYYEVDSFGRHIEQTSA